MRKIKKYGFLVVIIIVGILDLCYGVFTWYQKQSFMNHAKETTGHIYSISYHKKNSVAYIYYNIEGKRYDQLIVIHDLEVEINDSIKVYYDPKNPTKISSGEEAHMEIMIIVLGMLSLLLGSSLFLKTFRKRQ